MQFRRDQWELNKGRQRRSGGSHSGLKGGVWRDIGPLFKPVFCKGRQSTGTGGVRLCFKLPPRIFKPSYGPEEEEERKEALTLAHIRVLIFVSNLRISVFNREQDTEH